MLQRAPLVGRSVPPAALEEHSARFDHWDLAVVVVAVAAAVTAAVVVAAAAVAWSRGSFCVRVRCPGPLRIDRPTDDLDNNYDDSITK